MKSRRKLKHHRMARKNHDGVDHWDDDVNPFKPWSPFEVDYTMEDISVGGDDKTK